MVSTTEEEILDEVREQKWNIPKPFVIFEIKFKSSIYKVIKNVRAFDEESLIGNMGGYIGLFLGFAIWQAPQIIIKCLSKINSGFKIYC